MKSLLFSIAIVFTLFSCTLDEMNPVDDNSKSEDSIDQLKTISLSLKEDLSQTTVVNFMNNIQSDLNTKSSSQVSKDNLLLLVETSFDNQTIEDIITYFQVTETISIIEGNEMENILNQLNGNDDSTSGEEETRTGEEDEDTTSGEEKTSGEEDKDTVSKEEKTSGEE